MPKTIAVLGTFDTKAVEFSYLIDAIRAAGAQVLTIDVSLHEAAQGPVADVSCAQVAERAGVTMQVLKTLSRRDAMAWVIKGATAVAQELLADGRIDGLISMGGSGGTTIGASVMRALPVGFPKVMVSTLAGSVRIAEHVSETDILVINSVVDICGVNSILRKVYTLAAGVVVGAANAV